MAAEEVVITGVGMMTAVGLSGPETAAAVRAGLMRFQETTILDRRFAPFTMAEVPEEGLPELADPLRQPGLTSREARLLRLAAMPLQECVAALPENKRPVPLILALPDTKTSRPLDPARFLQLLALQKPAAFDVKRSVASLPGRAGGLLAVVTGADLIRSGQAEFVVAGGVDSYRDLFVLATLEKEARVKTQHNLDGFIPGEGAAFVLLAKRTAAQAAGLNALATIRGGGRGFESGHLGSDQPYQGNGLAGAVQQLVGAESGHLPVREVYSSMNGESYWAKEWGVAFLRSRPAFAEPHGMHHPADCCGDTGAAAAPLMIGLAALGVAGAYRASTVMIYASSDGGERAAMLITT